MQTTADHPPRDTDAVADAFEDVVFVAMLVSAIALALAIGVLIVAL